MPKPIIEQTAQLTFSSYYDLPYTIAQVAQHFGYTLNKTYLELPQAAPSLMPKVTDEAQALRDEIKEILPYTNLESEIARREILISPIMLKLLKIAKPQLNIEYSINVSPQLKGTIDYYLQGDQCKVLVVEAKLADTEKGFKQLIAEMMAVQELKLDDIFVYRAVTTGEIWRFARLDPAARQIDYNINLFVEPDEILDLLSILVGILAA